MESENLQQSHNYLTKCRMRHAYDISCEITSRDMRPYKCMRHPYDIDCEITSRGVRSYKVCRV